MIVGPPRRDLATLPKAHLHLHLDGAIREQTLRELAAAGSVGVPTLPTGRIYPSFDVFRETITACQDVLATADNLIRIIGEIIEDAADDGAVWIELSLWPGLFGGRLGSDHDAVELVLSTGRAAAARFGIGFGLMLAANRHAGPRAASVTARLAVDLATQGVVSFGLDGDEKAFPPSPFTEAFAIAKDGGLLCTPHAGELLGPESVADALTRLHADRILHGVRAIEDATLVTRLASSGTCLDVCPTSNYKLGVSTPETHPLALLLAAGVRCSVNADDPLLFGSGLLQEYELCRSDFSLSDHDLALVAASSLECSGAPAAVKAAGVTGVARWLEHGSTTPLP